MGTRLSRRDFLRNAVFVVQGLVAAQVLSACAGTPAAKPAEAPTAVKEAPTAGAQSSQPAASGDKLIVWGSDDWSGQADKFEAYRKFVAQCQDKLGFPIDYHVVTWTEIGDQEPIIMGADKYVADILCNGTGGNVCQWALQGKLTPWDDLLSAEFINKINPDVLANSKYKGKIYALECWPSWVIMFYNKELYQKAGLDPEKPPTTIQELEEHIVKLQGVAKTPFMPVWSDWWMGGWFNMIVHALGGKSFEGGTKEDPETLKFTYDAPECVEAITWMQHLWKDNLISQESRNLTQQDVASRFGLGDIGITSNFEAFAGLAEKEGVSKIVGKEGAFVFPGKVAGKGASILGDEVQLIPKTAKHPDWAAKYVECIHDPEIQKARAMTQYINPMFSELWQDAEIQKKLFYWKAILQAGSQAMPTNFSSKGGEVGSYFDGKLQEVVMQGADPSTTLKDVQSFAQSQGLG
jgi:ABC-type glycerol-3-phosphate transport system substrate-binding protein